MDEIRRKAIGRNFGLMFWIQALTEVKVINVISTIFYVHRGLTLAQILYTAVAYSVVSLLADVPSSYVADKWSRKGLITWSIILSVVYWVTNIFARGFWPFVAVMCIYSAGCSLMSGTDEALIYDSTRELGETEHSLRQLGKYFSAQRVFKIVTPIVAVLIARDLTDWQFDLILLVDVVANLLALVLVTRVTEPVHAYKAEKAGVGVIRGAVDLVKKEPQLINITFNRTLLFEASFIVWRVSSEYLQGIMTPVLMIGLATAGYQLGLLLMNIYSHQWFKKWTSEKVVNGFNWACVVCLGAFLANEMFWKSPLVAVVMFGSICVTEGTRWPYFSDMINKISGSYNRATVLSLTNIVKGVLDIPLLLLGSVLVTLNYSYFFGLTLMIGVVAVLGFRIKPISQSVS